MLSDNLFWKHGTLTRNLMQVEPTPKPNFVQAPNSRSLLNCATLEALVV